MAHTDHARWFVTYTMPADDHKYQHLMVVHTLDDEMYLRRTAIKKQMNPDLRIVAVERGTLDPEVDQARAAKLTAEIQAKGGEDWRHEGHGERFLNQKQVDKLKAERAKMLAEDAAPPTESADA